MHNFNQGPSNSVSADEARQVLGAWSNRQRAQGVDPGVDSVQALAAGLGVSETEVRQLLEDIRVQHRSQEIAAGILGQQQEQRKKSDVNAAVGAAIALIVIGLAVLAFFLFSGMRSREITVIEKGPPSHALTPTPPTPILTHNSAVYNDGHGHVISITGDRLTITDGEAVTSLSGQAATDECQRQISDLRKEIEAFNAQQNHSADDKTKAFDAIKRLETFQDGLKILVIGSSTPPPATAPKADDN